MARRRNIRRDKLLAAQHKAVARFKPKKGDRQSYVFLSKTGRVLPARTREKVFAIYITRNGKKRVVRPKDIGGLSSLKPHRVSTIQVAEALPRKIAARKFQRVFARRFDEGAQRFTVKPPAGRRVLDFEFTSRRFAGFLTRQLADLDPRSKRVFIISVAATIRLPDGRLKTLTTIPIEFGAAFLQQYKRGDLMAFARNKIWAVLGNELDNGFYVTTGSAAFIRQRSYNRGESPEDWRQRMPKGELVAWRYASDYYDREHVQLVQIDYSVTLE